MLARVKASYPWDTVQAHTGREYVKHEYRPVPDGDTPIEILEYQAEAQPSPPSEAAPVIDGMTKAELVELARSVGLAGYSTMNKAELIAALEGE